MSSRNVDLAKIARLERELGMEATVTMAERHAANRAEADRQGRRETLQTLADGVERAGLREGATCRERNGAA